MIILEFIELSIINLGLMIFIMRRWSIVSAEGLCMAYLFMAVLTDNVTLLVHYLTAPESLFLGAQEFDFRIYPTVVHIVGLLAFMAGLFLANPKPAPITRELGPAEIRSVRYAGIILVFLGLSMLAVAIYYVQALYSDNFYATLDTFRSSADISIGSFWYKGSNIAILGIGLIMVTVKKSKAGFLALLLCMMLVSFFLRSSKGGFELVVIWGCVLLYVYNRRFFKLLFSPRVLSVLVPIALLGIGAKNFIRNRPAAPEWSVGALWDSSIATMERRWGDDGLYRGYCQFVNMWPEYSHLFSGYRVGKYSVAGSVPRFIDPEKPGHPFRAIGFMIYSDFHNYETDTSAPTLVGVAYADKGLISVIGYQFLAGIFLTVLRQLSATRKSAIHLHNSYMMYVLFGALSAEAGMIELIDTLILAFGLIGVARFITLAIGVQPFPLRVSSPCRAVRPDILAPM
jgi:hypothetical protein